MSHSFTLWAARICYAISSLVLVGSLNIEVDIDGFYLLGGSCISASYGVEGTFKSLFLVSLALCVFWRR